MIQDLTIEREFIPTKQLPIESNYERLTENTSEKTQINYFKRFKGLCYPRKSNNKIIYHSPYENLSKSINEIEGKRRAGKLKRASVRQYKAAILYGLTVCYHIRQQNNNNTPNSLNEKSIDLLADFNKSVNTDQLKLLYERVNGWHSEESKAAKTLDNKAHLNSNTSSRKAKTFDAALYEHLLKATNDKFDILKLFVTLNIKLGLRPNGWYNARLIPRDYFNLLTQKKVSSKLAPTFGVSHKYTKLELNLINQSKYFLSTLYPDVMLDNTKGSDRPILAVKNSKNSHGRANGDWRYIVLDSISDTDMTLIPILITKLHELHASKEPETKKRNPASFDKLVTQSLQNQLKYWLSTDPVCDSILSKTYKKKLQAFHNERRRAEKNNKPWNRKPPIKSYPTLYSTRHQAVSEAKAQGMSSIVMAALFGHASPVTADRHYGHITDSWGSGIVTPHSSSIDNVLLNLTKNQLITEIQEIPTKSIVKAYDKMNNELGGKAGETSQDIISNIKVAINEGDYDKGLRTMLKDENLHDNISKALSTKLDNRTDGSGGIVSNANQPKRKL